MSTQSQVIAAMVPCTMPNHEGEPCGKPGMVGLPAGICGAHALDVHRAVRTMIDVQVKRELASAT